MGKRIIINVEEKIKRVALVVDEVLEEIHFDHKHSSRLTGDIFQGKVTRVMPGIEAAFVNIGLKKNGFLHVSDITDESSTLQDIVGEDFDEETGNGPDTRPKGIEEYLKTGDDILVQVVKDTIGTKGVRLSTNLSLPGRYIVLLPRTSRRGISRRIEAPDERERLKKILTQLDVPKSMGAIIRTFGEGKNLSDFSKDLKTLIQLWRKIYKRYREGGAPGAVHTEHDIIKRVVRDMVSEDIDEVVVDNTLEYRELKRYMNSFFPKKKINLKRYRGGLPIFDRYNLESQVEKVFSRKVWLNCGGYIVIDKTEALVAIDVNTGKNLGQDDANKTILETNLEAAEEIARQLRLRNMGGIVVLDFIDMRTKADRRKVYEALKKALKSDKARADILPVSDLGLVEMTRQRDRESLGEEFFHACSFCRGRGVIKMPDTVNSEIERRLKRYAAQKDVNELTIRAHPQIIDRLTKVHASQVAKILKGSRLNIEYESDDQYRIDEWNIFLKKNNTKTR